MRNTYRPPYRLTPDILRLVGDIGEQIGRYSAKGDIALTPQLRRNNRLRTIHASLAIENNALSLEQVTAVISGKRVLGPPRDIQEVRNAFAAYEKLQDWKSGSRADLLEAHGILLAGLVDRPGAFRSGNVGIYRGKELVHMAPPGSRVRGLMDDVLTWLKETDEHPLVASCVFHYELEFIHPFADGNGRMGRLWQTLILSEWKPLLAYLPVETVVRDRQQEYYEVLGECDRVGDATSFLVVMLRSLQAALREAIAAQSDTDQVIDQVTDQVNRLLTVLHEGPASASRLMARLKLSHRPTFRKNYLDAALGAGLIKREQPGAPRSPTQRYRITEAGQHALAERRSRG